MFRLFATIFVIIVIAFSTVRLATDEWKKDKSPVIFLFPIYIALVLLLLIWM